MLHYCILDIPADGTPRGVSGITDGVTDYLSHTDAHFEVDESIVCIKRREYANLGFHDKSGGGSCITDLRKTM